ncbi:MAG: hypothetical protein L5655_01870 [Thermosediminibacteraceae bacterium]|nr:hypothetical protein [Thermosediminibacteraceae bacterium]
MSHETARNVNVWQVDVRPFAATDKDPAKFCFEEGIVGIGWRVPRKPSIREEYWEMAKGIYAKDKHWVRAATPFLFQMQENDLVWIKDFAGTYYLGRIEGEWEYRDDPAFLQADLPNIRKCKFFKVGTDAPGGVVDSFRTGSIVQKINDYPVHLFSRIAYNKLAGEEFYDIKGEVAWKMDIFSLLTDQELEDIVALFLQQEGYYIIPSSLSKEETYNFRLAHKTTGERAFVRISGNTALNPDFYARFPHKTFLFSPAGYRASSGGYDHVVAIKKEEMENFIRSHENLMPFSVRLWLDVMEEIVKLA